MGEGRDLWDEAAETPTVEPAAGRRSAAVAVALQYDPDQGDAPVVTASGKGALAEQILQLAFANGVKVRTDPDLAQVLAAVEVDTVIPLEAFAAVAEILAYVYRANGRMPDAVAAAEGEA
ncbi:EscU/YscU/HrcU family type III secretion system export apparatus switch protein [Magnetospirillum sulfuroxidans]|uniref:EscU/YscU/HrcU family type III secretion system export apparatus switch protein n=1 Tax=Magnetospirillum sulfuroxidans TaxID=611300 RepID=A0ABS5IFG2_9PROT|nr:EscU/YscU/HrcU family type III secretion system export apparatus switch protein [Magnetospirillum sulfuroxidans]MBR9973169.1 EscU/YscU/HrcU family type III secretion system export apparatus switch protein [Magnetospirillum sulfuroxidans]